MSSKVVLFLLVAVHLCFGDPVRPKTIFFSGKARFDTDGPRVSTYTAYADVNNYLLRRDVPESPGIGATQNYYDWKITPLTCYSKMDKESNIATNNVSA
jgi:hypothetical protein